MMFQVPPGSSHEGWFGDVFSIKKENHPVFCSEKAF